MRPKYGVHYTLPLTIWISIFFLIPIIIVVLSSFMTKSDFGVNWGDFSLDAYSALNSPEFLKTLLVTIFIALTSTILIIAIAFPCAYYMARSKNAATLLLLIIIPFWVNLLIRIFAWMAMLNNEGMVNNGLRGLGIIDPSSSIQFLQNMTAVIIVHVYVFLPYAILPLYATIEKFDFGLLEAARDLGASHSRSIFSVLIPNVKTGLITAVLFTFIPILGSYAISNLVGGKEGYMLGNMISESMGKGNNYPRGAALSVLLIAITAIGLFIYYFITSRQEKIHRIKEES